MNTRLVLRLLLFLVVFFSGLAGLIYQIIWTRMLLLTFGSTTHSVVAVLSAFMAGMAIGSWGIGVVKREKIPPLLIYVALELTIGIFGIASPFLFALVSNIYSAIFNVLPGIFILPIKFLCTFLVLLPPTTAMGATIPLLIEYIKSQNKTSVGIETSRLYAINTFGACIGVILTGFFLIETVGLTTSIYIAGTINISIAILMYFRSKGLRSLEIHPTLNYKISEKTDATYPHQTKVIALSIFALSGLLGMAYEVVWMRLLTPTTGTYIYAFSSILAVLLFGIALGSLIYPILARKNTTPMMLFGFTHIAIGIGAVGSLFATSHVTQFSQTATVLLTILPSAIGMGLTFPIVASLTPPKSIVSQFVGTSYALNTLGSMIGPLVAGFLLLPFFGTIRTILLLSFTNFLFAALLFIVEKSKRVMGIQRIGIGLGVLGIACVLYLGAVRPNSLEERTKYALLQKFSTSNYSWAYSEDETASVLGFNNGLGDYGLLVDGVGMSVLVDETKLMAHLPLLIHPDPKDTLVIAFGMGTTYRSALTHDTNVDAIELVPSVPKMFPIFYPDANEVLKNPKGKIIINDGRNYVKLTNKKYDVITVDPPPPVNAAGTTVLYSKEFYQDSKRILKPGGLFTEWFFYGTRADDFQYLLKSFVDVFPHVAVFGSPRAIGIYLIGSDQPIDIDQTIIDQKFKNTKVHADLNEWGYWDAKNTPSLYIGDRSILLPFIGDAPPVTDDRPRTEYFRLRHKKPGVGIARNEVLFPNRY